MMKIIGKSIPRVDARSKADGSLKYCNDLEFNGLHMDIIRSSISYGKILSITYDEVFDFSDYIIVDYTDISASNVNSIIMDDQPFLAEDIVRFIGEPILLIAHKSKDALVKIKKHISIEYKEFEAVYTLQEAKSNNHCIFGEDNIYKSIDTCKGKKPDYSTLKSLSKVYKTPHQEQLYLEPQSMIARYNEGEIKIIGSMQCPFYVEAALQKLTNQKIEIEQSPTGGAFGGKEDYPSLMAAYVYLVSKKSLQDVKLVYTREDDIAYSTKRHPAEIEYTSYFDDKGKLHALDITISIDGGAYCTLTPVVQARAVLHVAGFYDCEYIEVHSNSYATNTPPNGAFRGFGAPQAIFAIERHMDDIAKYLHISPMQIREINLPTQHSKSVTDASIDEYTRVKDIFHKACTESSFANKYTNTNPNYGIGMALFMHGGGFTGAGETLLDSEVWLDVQKDGTVEIKISSVEMGQGASTVLAQIVADTLSIPLEMVHYHTPNTKNVANSGPTVASRTVMIVGNLLKEAACKLKDALSVYHTISEYQHSVQNYFKTETNKRFTFRYTKPDTIKWDEDTFYGNGYDGYSLGCYIAEVEIDPITYQVSVKNFYAYNDVGEVINPTLAEGQVEGGVAQGIGYALYERIVYEKGKIKNTHLSDYIIPMAADLPTLHIEFLHTKESPKGLGELPMNGPAAAICNALSNALDVEISSIPILPEMLEKLCR